MTTYKRYHVAIPVMVSEAGGHDIEPAPDEAAPQHALMIKVTITASSPEHAARLFWERLDGALGDP